MSVIYEPKGKAREYCELAVNLYKGCNYGCSYCYVPAATFQSREKFLMTFPKENIIERLKLEAPKYAGREVFMSFSHDPYLSIDSVYLLTRKAINILHEFYITVRILTKAGKRSMRDFDLLSANPHKSWYGATLTFLNEKESQEYEPLAAPPVDRMAALSIAHDKGIRTWVSLEPVIKPEQSLDIIKVTYDFVDEYKIGKWNYDTRGDEIDWRDFGLKAIELCKKYNKKFYIKKDLARYL